MLPFLRTRRALCTAGLTAVILLLAGGTGGSAQAQEILTLKPGSATSPGWTIIGDPSLFDWHPKEGTLRVTWDSSRPNSYFLHPLPSPANLHDDLSLEFTLTPAQITPGVTPGKPHTFELAVGFIHLAEATNATFLRGTAFNSPNLLELDYFPDTGFGATLSPTVISASRQFATSFNFPIPLNEGIPYHFSLSYQASTRTFSATVDSPLLDAPPRTLKPVILPPGFTGFTVDALAVCSYSDEGADGSLLATGVITDLRAVVPEPPSPRLTASLLPQTHQLRIICPLRSGWSAQLQVGTLTGPWIPRTPATPAENGVVEFLLPIDSVPAQATFRAMALPNP